MRGAPPGLARGTAGPDMDGRGNDVSRAASWRSAARLALRGALSRDSALAALDRSDEALGSCDAAVELGGPVADAHTDKGILCAGLGRSGEALAAYDAAIGSDPYAARPHLKKGQLLRRMGRDREANECYNDAIEIDGGGAVAAMAHAGRGETAYDAGRLEGALADYNAAIAIDPGLVAAHDGMSNTLAAMGRVAGAPCGHGQAPRSGPR